MSGIHIYQFHHQMSQFPPALHAQVNNDDVLYELFRDDYFDAGASSTLLEFVTAMDPEECPFCVRVPVLATVGDDWELSSPCQLHGGPAE